MQNTHYEAYTFDNGTIDACYLDTSLGVPCEQGSISAIGIDARSPADIQAGVKFAAAHNLRLVIKNTGHDYLGRSTAKGSFLIWTHNMKNITYHQSFTPEGGNTSIEDVITLEAGVQWQEAYAAADAQARVIVGGFSAGGSVGSSGGWVSGGGHSALAPQYGLGVDNVVQMTVVTADGSHLTANEFLNSDLFWALRGGGGGTYGVLTSVSYRTHPSTPFSAAFFSANRTATNYTDPDAVQKIFSQLVRITPDLVSKGYGGYGGADSSAIYFFLLSPTQTYAQANETFQPFYDYAFSLAEAGGLNLTNFTVPYPSFTSWYSTLFPTTGQVGSPNEISSWLLPKDVMTKDPDGVAKQLLSVKQGISYYLVTGGAVANVGEDSLGVNPAWRKAAAYIVTGIHWEEGASTTEIETLRTTLKEDMKIIENIAPDSGAYLNEASRYEFDWKKSFFGSHYDKLRQIKQKYDPSSLFIVWEGVGSDEWDSSLNCPL